MAEITEQLSDAEVFEMLSAAQECYEQYLRLNQEVAHEQLFPTYTPTNAVGLVIDAVLD